MAINVIRDRGIITWRGEGGWEMGEIWRGARRVGGGGGGGGGVGKWVKYAPKLGYTPPLIKQNLFSNPPHIMIILRLTSPPHPTLEKSLLQLIPSYLVSTCWISFSGTNITSNDSSTYVKEWSESLDSELVSSWHELWDSSSSTASLALRFPHAWVKSSI